MHNNIIQLNNCNKAYSLLPKERESVCKSIIFLNDTDYLAELLFSLHKKNPQCIKCGARKTPQWRTLRTTKIHLLSKCLCNRCGLKYRNRSDLFHK